MLAGLRGAREVKEVCRKHGISKTLYHSWREKLLEGGREALAGKEERQGEKELRRRIAQFARAFGSEDLRARDCGGSIARVGVRMRAQGSQAGRARVRRRDRGYRVVTAFVQQRLGVAVNRKRVLPVMRERKLIQLRRPLECRKRPGFFRVERSRQLWQLDINERLGS